LLKERLKRMESTEQVVLDDSHNSRLVQLESQLQENEGKVELISQQFMKRIAIAETTNSKLENELRVQRFENQELRNQIDEFGDYDEVKRELDIFKSFEFDLDPQENIPLERMLLDKNKKLENDYTVLKMETRDLKLAFDTNTNKVQALTAEIAEKSALVAKLESDIHRLNTLQQRSINPNEHLESLITEKKSTDHSIIPILTSQRDRYKQRFEETQKNIFELTTKVTTLQDEVNRLQLDNVGLYEKLRFTESFSSSSRQVI
jgi:homeobox protein cut-like